MKPLSGSLMLVSAACILLNYPQTYVCASASAPNPAATAPATKAALPALDTPEAALHELLVAIFTGDQERVNRATIEVPGREMLTQGEKVPAEMAAEIDKLIDGMHLQRLKIGDSIKVKTTSVPEGMTVVMDESHINDNRTEITGPNLPFPFILVRDGKQWKVDPAPLIASRKAAQAAREKAATQTKPAVTSPATKP